MSHNNFRKDLKNSRDTEKEVLELLLERNPDITHYKINKDYRYDIALKSENNVIYFEIKEDFKCEYTGNIAVEIESYGTPGGPFKTESDYFIYVVHGLQSIYFFKIKTNTLLEATRNQVEKKGKILAGDSGSNTYIVLFSWEEFIDMEHELL